MQNFILALVGAGWPFHFLGEFLESCSTAGSLERQLGSDSANHHNESRDNSAAPDRTAKGCCGQLPRLCTGKEGETGSVSPVSTDVAERRRGIKRHRAALPKAAVAALSLAHPPALVQYRFQLVTFSEGRVGIFSPYADWLLRGVFFAYPVLF